MVCLSPGLGGLWQSKFGACLPAVPDGWLNHMGTHTHPTSPIWAWLSHTPFGAETSRQSQLLAISQPEVFEARHEDMTGGEGGNGQGISFTCNSICVAFDGVRDLGH